MKRVATLVVAALIGIVGIAGPASAASTGKHDKGAMWGENRSRRLVRR